MYYLGTRVLRARNDGSLWQLPHDSSISAQFVTSVTLLPDVDVASDRLFCWPLIVTTAKTLSWQCFVNDWLCSKITMDSYLPDCKVRTASQNTLTQGTWRSCVRDYPVTWCICCFGNQITYILKRVQLCQKVFYRMSGNQESPVQHIVLGKNVFIKQQNNRSFINTVIA